MTENVLDQVCDYYELLNKKCVFEAENSFLRLETMCIERSCQSSPARSECCGGRNANIRETTDPA